MCETVTNEFEDFVRRSIAGPSPIAPPPVETAPDAGSRRRRLWELDAQAQCPILGVCMPLELLRKVVDKTLGRRSVEDHYKLHCGVVAACRYRSPVAEAVQRELDRRYRLPLQKAARLKTTDALASWWEEALRSRNIAGPFWATLTHPRCTVELAQRIEGQVHMLQHQVGAATRVDHDRFEALRKRADELAAELAGAAQRAHRQQEEHAHRVDALEALVVQLRAQLLARDDTVAALRELQAAAPELKSRLELTQEIECLREQRADQQRVLLQARQEADRQRRRADELGEELRRRDACAARARMVAANVKEVADAPFCADRLDARAVLCVGGRTASVPVYRQLIERIGGRFLHHDGGDEHNPTKLDATLAAADLVICQTGCISHDAYWRVKDHCKRTGKRCIFVENPSGTGLRKALETLVPARTASTAQS